ncbi:TetR/AcrR family transcriptional regulator [Streptomyces sp. RY43-2]|uniref:TetR/AcrR family transcriptional regulator n=1 Tax=Streptomyces macrolidinus TaxID=2952607 RepID=A0ABT0Z8H4_9ACTN|nr:TetR/AcrR family transcriptional regulator [Streptomyces macrolidinus]MCN9239537.1 TetR/AcrR family transcriptional regulator [Streptomyces macrolidinus]
MSTDHPEPASGERRNSATPRDPAASAGIRRRLLDEAARVLVEEGPAALSARRLVKAVGASTMAVYTHFGSMPGLVREVMREGFARFRTRVEAVRPALGPDADPVSELAGLCRVYQEFARAEPEVYAVLFGGSPLAGFELTDEDRQMGARVIRFPFEAILRCAAAGRFRTDIDAGLAVRQLFAQMHGLAQLARAGYILGDYRPDDVLAGLLRDFAVAAGDDPDRAARSVRSGLGQGAGPGA